MVPVFVFFIHLSLLLPEYYDVEKAENIGHVTNIGHSTSKLSYLI